MTVLSDSHCTHISNAIANNPHDWLMAYQVVACFESTTLGEKVRERDYLVPKRDKNGTEVTYKGEKTKHKQRLK